MKHVSLNKIRPSALLKVPGLLILGLLAVAFLLFPLAAFAGCGGAKAVPAATLKVASVEPIFGPNCGGAASTKNATVTGNAANPAPSSKTSGANPSPASSSLLAGITKCRFVEVKPGQKVVLHNGDIVVGNISKADQNGNAGNVGDTIFGMVINGQFRAINGDGKGGHAAGILNAKTVNFTVGNGGVANGTSDNSSSTAGIDATPND